MNQQEKNVYYVTSCDTFPPTEIFTLWQTRSAFELLFLKKSWIVVQLCKTPCVSCILSFGMGILPGHHWDSEICTNEILNAALEVCQKWL